MTDFKQVASINQKPFAIPAFVPGNLYVMRRQVCQNLAILPSMLRGHLGVF